MANEITVRSTMTVKKDASGLNRTIGVSGGVQIDMTGGTLYHVTRSIATSEVALTTFEGITTAGQCYLKNNDATNFVEWGFSTGVYGGKMLAGETAGPFRMSSLGAVYLKSDTAACNVEIVVVEA